MSMPIFWWWGGGGGGGGGREGGKGGWGKKNIINLSTAELAQTVVKVKASLKIVADDFLVWKNKA